jgi:uncharacterized protein (DUF2141 family)
MPSNGTQPKVARLGGRRAAEQVAMRLKTLFVAGCVAVVTAAAAGAEEAPVEQPGQSAGASENLASVHVIADSVESDRGDIWLALCDTSLSVEGCPHKKSVPAAAGFVEVTFDDIPPGMYAVVGYHDVNGDGAFDSLLGVPREPYALSGAAGDMLVPTFEDAVLDIKPGLNDVMIRMRGIADW